MKPFTYYLRVRYGECDAQKVVFNSRYGDYVDVAVNEFLRAMGYESELVSGELDFSWSSRPPNGAVPRDSIRCWPPASHASRLGTTSFTFTTEFRIAGDERVICTVETVYVMVEAHTLAKKPIPDDVRAAFERGAPGVETDHAGYSVVQLGPPFDSCGFSRHESDQGRTRNARTPVDSALGPGAD